jgi:hypothetical protein
MAAHGSRTTLETTKWRPAVFDKFLISNNEHDQLQLTLGPRKLLISNHDQSLAYTRARETSHRQTMTDHTHTSGLEKLLMGKQ